MLSRLRSALSILLLCSSLAVYAQARLSVRGSVVDSTGSVVPGVALTLQTPEGTGIAQTQSDAGGRFVFPALAAGDYVLQIPAFSGFAGRTLPIHVGANVNGLKVSLALAAITQQVTVNAGDQLSTDSSDNKDTVAVSGNDLRKLPALDLDYVAALSSFLDASSGPSGGTSLIVDGIEMKSVGVSPSAIQEVRINNDPYSAEFNRPGRGRIEITTKPGSPVYHGEANFLFRDAALNARNHFAVTRPPEARRMFEGHFTGPIAHSRHTSFIASAVYGQRNTAVAVHALGPSGPIDENVLTPRRNSQASLRVTHDFSDSHRLQVGYNFAQYTNVNAGVGGLVLPEAGYNTLSREDDLIFNDRLILTPNLIHQLLVTFEKDEDVTSSVSQAQAVNVNGAFTGGGAQADLNRTENTVHVNEVLSWSHGRHYIRFGGQLPQFSKRAVDDHTNRLGTFAFASLADYTSDRPYVFTAQQGVGRGVYWINEAGGFFQDEMKLTPHLQVTLGMRYDWQTYLSDNNNFAPRLSVAYAPGKSSTIIRAGSGVFYDRTGGDYPATFKLHNGVVLDSVQIEDPAYPIVSSSTFAATPTNLVREAANLRAPYTIQSSIGVEHQIHKTATISVTYRNSVQVKSFRSRDINAPILTPNPALTGFYPRPNPAFGQIQQVEAGGRQIFNGLDLSFRGRAGRWFSGQAQYTLSRAENNSGGIRSFPQNQYQPNAEWGRANFDRLHALELIGNINPDHWLTLGISGPEPPPARGAPALCSSANGPGSPGFDSVSFGPLFATTNAYIGSSRVSWWYFRPNRSCRNGSTSVRLCSIFNFAKRGASSSVTFASMS